MAAPAAEGREERFARGVCDLLGGWEALQGFGGPQSPEKAAWLPGAVLQFFTQNADLEQEEVEDFLAEVMDNEFDTSVEDGSLQQVSRALLSLWGGPAQASPPPPSPPLCPPRGWGGGQDQEEEEEAMECGDPSPPPPQRWLDPREAATVTEKEGGGTPKPPLLVPHKCPPPPHNCPPPPHNCPPLPHKCPPRPITVPQIQGGGNNKGPPTMWGGKEMGCRLFWGGE
ncbi:pre-rRNA-processing protein TSR2 homolog [Phaenicophaeus curvirostris]|uniref:pre-rRNA-processing protein TSR2 homolog n=1 Tax=Phaenicophaeus curvirostris TaxID=33595 RepID=UPI0037F09AAE